MQKIFWDENANPVDTNLAHVIYELRREDPDDLMMDSVSIDDFNADTASEVYDALVLESRVLERKMQVMRRVMNRTGSELKVREDNGPDDLGVSISKPFKRNGTSNVAVMFQLTDGQTISIVFHNPDTTPNKIGPTDELISWKWMINKKDVTIAVAPERGKDLNVQEVARRIMKLAEKNSAAFQRANQKRAERIANIEKQKGEIEELEAELTKARGDCEVSEVEYQDALAKLDDKRKERTVAIEGAEERKKAKAKEEAERLAEEEKKKQQAAQNVGKTLDFKQVWPGRNVAESVYGHDLIAFLNEKGVMSKEAMDNEGDATRPLYVATTETKNGLYVSIWSKEVFANKLVDISFDKNGAPYINTWGHEQAMPIDVYNELLEKIGFGNFKKEGVKEAWETFEIKNFDDLHEYQLNFGAWDETTPQGKRIIETLRDWGWTDAKGQNDEGMPFFARITDNGAVEMWDEYNYPITTGKFAVFVLNLLQASENGTLTHLNEADKEAKPGTIRRAEEAEVAALEREEKAFKQWDGDKSYLQSLIDGTANMDDRNLHKTKLKAIRNRVEDDAEGLAMWKAAMTAWKNYALNKAKETLNKRG